jgi:hypothetical protein
LVHGGGAHRQTLERAEEPGLSVQEGDPWYDVDEPEDLARLREEVAERLYLAPRTADFLERMWASRVGRAAGC